MSDVVAMRTEGIQGMGSACEQARCLVVTAWCREGHAPPTSDGHTTHRLMVVVATAGAVGVESTTPGVEQHGRAEVDSPGHEGSITMPVGETGEGDAAVVKPSPLLEGHRQGLEKVVPSEVEAYTAPREGQEAVSESVHGDRPGPPVAGAGKGVADSRSLIGGPGSSWGRPRD
jgi:hypothetical protein